jgi:hypothetical protein
MIILKPLQAESKARNILKKLLRISAAKGQGSGEYGIITEADVEILCANCELEDLNTMNNGMGGEPASKDPELFQIAGADTTDTIHQAVPHLLLCLYSHHVTVPY